METWKLSYCMKIYHKVGNDKNIFPAVIIAQAPSNSIVFSIKNAVKRFAKRDMKKLPNPLM